MDVAMIQPDVSDLQSRRGRFNHVQSILQELCEQEPRPNIILLPEIWGSGFFSFQDYAIHSEEAEGETYTFLAPWAEKINCYQGISNPALHFYRIKRSLSAYFNI